MSASVDERSPPTSYSPLARRSWASLIAVAVASALVLGAPRSAAAELGEGDGAPLGGNDADPHSTDPSASPPTLVDVDAAPVTFVEPGPEAMAAGVDKRVEELDKQLADLQHSTRLYLGGWIGMNIALGGAQLAVALTANRPEVRGNYFVGSALAVAGIGVLLAQPWPGLKAHKKYRAINATTTEEKVLKMARGEEFIKRQRHWDHIAVHGDKHIAAGVIATAAGLGVGLGFGSLKEGLSRALGVLFVLELQILTRPGTYFTPKTEPGKKDGPYLAFAPLIDRYTQGAALTAVF